MVMIWRSREDARSRNPTTKHFPTLELRFVEVVLRTGVPSLVCGGRIDSVALWLQKQRLLFPMFEANPVLRRVQDSRSYGTLTFDGVIHRTGLLFLLTAASYGATWFGIQNGLLPVGTALIAAIVGVVLALIITFGRVRNPFVIGAYAVAEGALLGTVSLLAELRYPGIAFQASAATFGCFMVVLGLYRFRILVASPGLVKGLLVAIAGIAVLYVVNLIASLFGHPLAFLTDNSPLSIGLSCVIVLVASLSFVIDFAQIENAVSSGADERDGWLLAFGLLVGLVWLYLEILRLLSKVRSRD